MQLCLTEPFCIIGSIGNQDTDKSKSLTYNIRCNKLLNMNDGSSPTEDFFVVKIDDEKMMRGAGVIPLSHL